MHVMMMLVLTMLVYTLQAGAYDELWFMLKASAMEPLLQVLNCIALTSTEACGMRLHAAAAAFTMRVEGRTWSRLEV